MPSPLILVSILLAMSVAANGILAKLYVSAKQDIARVQQAYDSFKAQVKVEGEEAQKKAAVTEMADKLRKDTSDAENRKTKSDLAGVYAAYRSLRDSRIRAGSGEVSRAATFTPSADRSCFDSAKFVGAMGILETGILSVTERGDGAITDLDSARRWAQQR